MRHKIELIRCLLRLSLLSSLFVVWRRMDWNCFIGFLRFPCSNPRANSSKIPRWLWYVDNSKFQFSIPPTKSAMFSSKSGILQSSSSIPIDSSSKAHRHSVVSRATAARHDEESFCIPDSDAMPFCMNCMALTMDSGWCDPNFSRKEFIIILWRATLGGLGA